MKHVAHGSGVRHPLSGLIEDRARETRIGGRFRQISSLLRTVVVVASHLIVLRHRSLVRELRLLVGLWNILGKPKLVDIVLVSRQIVGKRHLLRSIHVPAGHIHHAFIGSKVSHSEGTAQWGLRSSTLHWHAMVKVGGIVPPWGSH